MTFRVLTGMFAHETNAFSKLPTEIANFRDYVLFFGDEVAPGVAGSVVEPQGVIEAAAELDWQLVQTVAAWAVPSGPVAREVWDLCAGAILDAATENANGIDGVLLPLHGAMATVDHDDAEGELLEQLRQRIGSDLPVAITLDLHANVTDRMARHADIITAYRTYPHIDQIETTKRGARLLHRAMIGEVKPHTVVARRQTLEGLDDGRTTTKNPMTELLGRAERLEAEDAGVLCVSIHAGFTPADLDQAGPSVCVTGDGNDARFQAIAEDYMDYAWETRHFDSNTYYGVADGIAEIKRLMAEPGDGPIVVADGSDNPGSGAYGDSTFLLAGMIEAGLENAAFATICDAEAAAQLVAAGEGATVDVTLGGKVDPTYGPPLAVSGEVIRVTDGSYVALGPRWRGVTQKLGPTAVLRVGGVDVIVATNRVQVTEIETYTHADIEPREKAVVAVKSIQHFRAAYAPIAKAIVVVDSGALASRDCAKLPFTRLRRPIFPLDLD